MKRNVHWNGSRRGWLTLLILLVVIPATIYLCYRAGGRVYYLASVLIILYTMVPFFLVFERRKPQARELVVLAVLCAIAVASRAAFKMIDHFKPMAHGRLGRCLPSARRAFWPGRCTVWAG